MSRRRPLHTFGASFLAIVQNACTKAQGIDGPMGSLTRRTATFVSSTFPFIYSMQYQWLAMLSFIDDHILRFESLIETIFPPSIHLFNWIDKLVYMAECLPGWFDDALNIVPKIIHQLPFLDWTSIHLISWLNFFISTLMYWGSKSIHEKDVMIDTICNNPRGGLPISLDKSTDSLIENDEFPSISISYSSPEKVGKVEGCHEMPNITQCQYKEILFCPELYSAKEETKMAESAVSPAESDEVKSVGMKVETDTMRCSYKEMLEKGTKENDETEEDNHNNTSQYETPRSTNSEEEAEIKTEKDVKENIIGFHQNDPILELYEASWHLK